MKKRITLLTTVILCIMCIVAGAAANSVITKIKAELRSDFTVKIDGEVKHFKNADGETVYPVLYDGTTYLPIRAIGEIMGKKVYWYENDKLIELKDDENKNETTVTDADVIIGGSDKPTDIVVTDKPDKQNQQKTDKNVIGVDRAKQIALEKAGLGANQVIFEKAELDFDNGIWEYEIEFRQGNTEYDAEVNAQTGKIIKFEKDID